METENKIPKHNITVLKAEVAKLKVKVVELEVKNVDLEAKITVLTAKENICPECKKPMGKFLKRGRSEIFKDSDIMANFYKCKNCGHKYEDRSKLY